ncbi:hypothetical protein PQ465_15320 [Sphingobacterium oryzagri]|uniref:Uncharacterized protein n=1 Tax=Sphingobacterium oryzagri TaxID=3025669 RepID=A0ABY7WDV8_9SPHI|nr:hypothetical protein [Sphingobacterium sp. KACC 22765]WDF67670.1 hypothetical protein PQ465_15320 [Sphingobacterium sp. KACC 22765]
MQPLEIHYRGKIRYAPIECLEKGFGLKDYRLMGKNGVSIYIFRKEEDVWRMAYGDLDAELREAIISALILRFDPHVVKVFLYKGARQVVEVSYATGANCWNVHINHFYIGHITHNKKEGKWTYSIRNKGTWLLPRHMEAFIEMIKSGEIAWPAEYR